MQVSPSWVLQLVRVRTSFPALTCPRSAPPPIAGSKDWGRSFFQACHHMADLGGRVRSPTLMPWDQLPCANRVSSVVLPSQGGMSALLSTVASEGKNQQWEIFLSCFIFKCLYKSSIFYFRKQVLPVYLVRFCLKKPLIQMYKKIWTHPPKCKSKPLFKLR